MAHRRLIAFAAALAACLLSSAVQAAEPDCRGPRKTVAVDEFQAAEVANGEVAGPGLTALLTEALAKDCRFLVVEREALSSLETEQNVTGQARPRRLLAAGILIRGAVTAFDPAVSGGSVKLGGLPVGRGKAGTVGMGGKRAMVSISLRVIDAATGEVIATSRADGIASSGGADVGMIDFRSGQGFQTETFRATPIGKAADEAIRKAVEQIALGTADTPWSAYVVEADADGVYVGAGADQNLQPGARLAVWRVRKVLTDPATGVVLETLMDQVGELKIETVREKVSVAVVTSGQTPARGDLVRLAL